MSDEDDDAAPAGRTPPPRVEARTTNSEIYKMTKTATTKKTKTRRTPEQIVADLQAEIDRVKTRAASAQAKKSDDGKAFVAAVRALDKALRVATDVRNEEMAHALETARAALGEQLVRMGVRAPEARKRRRKAG